MSSEPTRGSKKRHCILIVDDEVADRELVVERLRPLGFDLETAADGHEAWEKLQRDSESYQLVLLDRRMPRLSGLDLLKKMKQGSDLLQRIPVIFQTGASDLDEMRQGIEAGCFYYLVKPYDTGVLHSIVRAAIDDFERYENFRNETRKGIRALATLRRASFEFSTLQEAGALSTLLSYAFPDPETQVVGLSELLINAVEHGNLGISYDEKGRLISEGIWEEEIERRLELEEHRKKKVQVELDRDDNEIRVTVRDQGKGFDWARFLEIEPGRAFDTHGRGIAIARIYSFSRIDYRGCGNEVVASLDL